jgi:hypothetical protein
LSIGVNGDLPFDEHAHTVASHVLWFCINQHFPSYLISEFILKFSVCRFPVEAQFVANNFVPSFLFIILHFDPYVFPDAALEEIYSLLSGNYSRLSVYGASNAVISRELS